MGFTMLHHGFTQETSSQVTLVEATLSLAASMVPSAVRFLSLPPSPGVFASIFRGGWGFAVKFSWEGLKRSLVGFSMGLDVAKDSGLAEIGDTNLLVKVENLSKVCFLNS